MKIVDWKFVLQLLGEFLEHAVLTLGFFVFCGLLLVTCSESLPPSTQEQTAPRVYACECDEVRDGEDDSREGR